ncbi:hypothetical protein pdam_00018983 [Pocillopora damicornis]|uniref:Immunoglobulin V-set domain-containing protein n=1 Tax=Pocillopora damicornis TaxID=46731 RepID=A0A3M6TD11_POCDA|nr:uncharacterized protein LOC113679287 isoform X1 [Pocillopora damicornis]RMX39260.1 hypothetical protein pdam_00018983 [Pocillopora damicornis]
MAMGCGAILDTSSTEGLLSKWPVNMKFLLCGLVCILTLIQAPVATAGDVCDDPRVTVTVNSGVDAKLYYNRSNHEDDQHFRGYRAYAHSSVFAFLNKTGLDGACTHPVKEICLQGKAEFKKVNQSLLMIEIFNVAVNDSGKYKVVALFSYTHNDTETEKCLQVHHLNVSDNSTGTTTSPVPPSTQVYSPSSSPETTTSPVPQSTQVYSSSSSSGPCRQTLAIVFGILFAITLLITLFLFYRLIKLKKQNSGEPNNDEMALNHAPAYDQPDNRMA